MGNAHRRFRPISPRTLGSSGRGGEGGNERRWSGRLQFSVSRGVTASPIGAVPWGETSMWLRRFRTVECTPVFEEARNLRGSRVESRILASSIDRPSVPLPRRCERGGASKGPPDFRGVGLATTALHGKLRGGELQSAFGREESFARGCRRTIAPLAGTAGGEERHALHRAIVARRGRPTPSGMDARERKRSESP